MTDEECGCIRIGIGTSDGDCDVEVRAFDDLFDYAYGDPRCIGMVDCE